jgi:BirA family biotin operon repressor/biotin-[acetyl-CoA-carboxylase] ligase
MKPSFAPIGNTFTELLSVDSTNNYAMGRVHEGVAQHGDVVLAHVQTAGKGQRHKAWVSQGGANLTLSVVLEPAQPLSHAFYLSMAMAVAVRHFFAQYASFETKVKWPNDLYWRDRKAGGLLIENVIQGSQWRYAIVGIGININQTAFEGLPNPVSLKQITGEDFDIVELGKELCLFLQKGFEMFLHNVQGVHTAYHQHLYKVGEQVKLKQGGRVFTATIKGVMPFGRLITEHATEETFDIGEVELVL